MTTRRSTWRVPTALVALGTVPVISGALRLVDLSGGTTGMPPNPRFDASPWPVVVHIVSATVFALLGAFQFVPRPRQRRLGWHRRAGRVVAVAGLGVALSALWLNQFFPRAGAAREVLYPLRLAFGVAMLVTLAFGFAAARRRDFARHSRWMIRAYAIGLVAGTQVFTLGFGQAIFGHADLTTALLMGAAWGINLAVAEWAIRRRGVRPERRRPGTAPTRGTPAGAPT
jgi:uncharacterized membrane protein